MGSTFENIDTKFRLYFNTDGPQMFATHQD